VKGACGNGQTGTGSVCSRVLAADEVWHMLEDIARGVAVEVQQQSPRRVIEPACFDVPVPLQPPRRQPGQFRPGQARAPPDIRASTWEQCQ
jgi:hypothetical protein